MLDKKNVFGILAVVVGVGFASLAHSNYYPNQDQNATYSTDKIVSDQDLSKKINDKIGPGWFSKGYDQVRAQVRNGKVSLEGSVKTWEDKEKVEKEIRNIEGVRGVNSQITVQDPSQNNRDNRQVDNRDNRYNDNRDNRQAAKTKDFPRDRASTPMDDQLNKKIRDQVSKGWLTNSYEEIVLVTNNGYVLIEGIVEDMDDQQDLLNDIRKIEGVRGVKSNVRIKNPK